MAESSLGVRGAQGAGRKSHTEYDSFDIALASCRRYFLPPRRFLPRSLCLARGFCLTKLPVSHSFPVRAELLTHFSSQVTINVYNKNANLIESSPTQPSKREYGCDSLIFVGQIFSDKNTLYLKK